MFRILLVSIALLAPLASAQADDEACTEAAPCEWVVDLDGSGFDAGGLGDAAYNGTVGDWYVFSILNADDVEHTLTWSEYGQSWTVAAADVLETPPFELTREGSFLLRDAPSGDAATIQVFLGDVVDTEADAEAGAGQEQTQPTLGVVLMVVSLLGLVALKRR